MLYALFKICFHLSPLIPVYFERYYFAGALLLTVAACYIKTIKLTKELELNPNMGSDAARSLLRARNFWKAFTFLR